MKLTLSFDNGPHPEATPRVLDVLARHGIRAHFFVLGKQIATDEGRALVERALADGHLVGNHSYSHSVPLGDDRRPDAVAREIVATDELLAPLTPGVRVFRPFGGGGAIGPHLFSEAAIEHLRASGYTCVLWNSVPGDWLDPSGWPTTALADMSRQGHTLMVLHDLPGACAAALEGFVVEARRRGVEFTLELPPGCVPIVEGKVVGDLGPLVRATAEQGAA